MNEAFARFKDLADKKSEIFDQDLQALVSDMEPSDTEETYHLDNLEVHSKTGTRPSAQLTLTVRGESVQSSAEGSGPVDAAFKAIEKIAQSGADLLLFLARLDCLLALRCPLAPLSALRCVVVTTGRTCPTWLSDGPNWFVMGCGAEQLDEDERATRINSCDTENRHNNQ